MTTPPEIIVGTERTRILQELGLPRGLLDALADPTDPITAQVAASDGTVLAEIVDLPVMDDVLPPGRIVPVCHVEESMLWYVLAVEQPEGWVLLDWTPEGAEPIDGGVPGWLTDLVVQAWEMEAAPDPELVRWAARIGHPSPERLVRELAASSRGTEEAHRRWRDAFLQSL